MAGSGYDDRVTEAKTPHLAYWFKPSCHDLRATCVPTCMQIQSERDALHFGETRLVAQPPYTQLEHHMHGLVKGMQIGLVSILLWIQ